MGRVIVSEFVSLDGVFEDPGGAESYQHGGWTFTFDQGADGAAFKLEELQEADALLLGRVTYEGFAAAWPTITDDAGFAEKMNSMPKYVVSTTLEEATWTNSTIVSGDVPAELATLREQDHNLLVAGSGTLVATLMEHDLVDEYRLMVFPIVLGSGKRLFTAGRKQTLSLAETKPVGSSGVVVLTYRRA